MEAGLVAVCKEVLSKPKVKGFMVIDEKGLCLQTEGINENLSGIFSAIAHSAKLLDSEDNPVVELETEKGRILIQEKGNIVTTIYKCKSDHSNQAVHDHDTKLTGPSVLS